MSTGHGNDFGFFHQKVFRSVQSTSKQFRGPEFLKEWAWGAVRNYFRKINIVDAYMHTIQFIRLNS